jgi:catechol 2,3-dioxygenase-like lactoylglutathione lyase family enzyme
MLHHISFPVSDLAAAKALYGAALAALGYRLVAEAPGFAGYGVIEGQDMFALREQPGARAAGPGFHLAFAAPSRRAVDGFFAAALAHGAQGNGAPGLRPQYGPGYYAAFVIDADGHRLEAVHQ